MTAKISVSDVDTVVLLLLTNSKQNLKVHMKGSNTDFIPTQGLNLGLLHCRQMLYHLSHQGSPYTHTHTHTHTQLFFFKFFFQLGCNRILSRVRNAIQ